MAKEDT
jgi:hypothetical protein